VEGKNKSVDLQGLKCSQCDKLVHWSCDGMTKEMFGNIKNAAQYFRCQECVKATKDGPNGLLAQIQVTLNDMNGKMTGFMERLTGVEKDVKALKDKMVTLESQGQGSQTLASLTRHVKEALKREMSVIGYGLPEQDYEEEKECKSQGKKDVLTLMAQLTLPESSLREVFRLGKKSDKTRPILVNMDSTASALDFIHKQWKENDNEW